MVYSYWTCLPNQPTKPKTMNPTKPKTMNPTNRTQQEQQ
jgi:hypothetical protein